MELPERVVVGYHSCACQRWTSSLTLEVKKTGHITTADVNSLNEDTIYVNL